MDNVSANITDLCEDAKLISGTWQLKTILILECIIGILAIFSNAIAVFLLYRVEVFHLNLRVLLGHLSFDLMLYAITVAEKAFRRLSTPVCELPIPFIKCVRQDLFVQAPLHNAMFALVVLLLERVYCTFRFRTYDRTMKRPYLAIALLMCSWAATLVIETNSYMKATPNWVPYCEITMGSNAKGGTAFTGSFVSMEILAIMVMICVFWYNRYLLNHTAINRAQFDLSSRFQVDQNVKLNDALLPSELLHIISYLPSYSSLLTANIPSLQMALETRIWFLHLTYLWRLIYAFVHPTILIALNPNLRQSLQKTTVGQWLFGCKSPRVSDETAVSSGCKQADAHFEHLCKMWSDDNHKNGGRKYGF